MVRRLTYRRRDVSVFRDRTPRAKVSSSRCDRLVMSYAPGVFPCPPSLKSAGQRRSGIWLVAPHRTDSGWFHRVLFPNLFPNVFAFQGFIFLPTRTNAVEQRAELLL